MSEQQQPAGWPRLTVPAATVVELVGLVHRLGQAGDPILESAVLSIVTEHGCQWPPTVLHHIAAEARAAADSRLDRDGLRWRAIADTLTGVIQEAEVQAQEPTGNLAGYTVATYNPAPCCYCLGTGRVFDPERGWDTRCPKYSGTG